MNIEMTPSIHYDHDVTLKIKIEVLAESGTETISGVTEPIISQRVVDQVIRLREGEASILGGIQNQQEQNNWSSIPGLSAIPFSSTSSAPRTAASRRDIVFVIVPHIVRSQELNQANLRVIDTGEGQTIDLRHADDGSAATAPAAVPAVQPAAAVRPVVGSAPAQSAIEAAPTMLAQLRSDMSGAGGPETTAQTTVQQPTLRRPLHRQALRRPARRLLQHRASLLRRCPVRPWLQRLLSRVLLPLLFHRPLRLRPAPASRWARPPLRPPPEPVSRFRSC